MRRVVVELEGSVLENFLLVCFLHQCYNRNNLSSAAAATAVYGNSWRAGAGTPAADQLSYVVWLGPALHSNAMLMVLMHKSESNCFNLALALERV